MTYFRIGNIRSLSHSLETVTYIPDVYLLYFCAVQTTSKFVLLASADHFALAMIIANAFFSLNSVLSL